jgi:hypothetical protein
MKIVQTGNIYKIYADDLIVKDSLPAQFYNVCFSERAGFFLEKTADITVTEKMYGVHEAKVQKILGAFDVAERNLGVILSGEKGIGKSMSAKLLAERGVQAGYPVLLVTSFVPGISDFLAEIGQEAIIVFDEFDKTFCGKKEHEGTALDPQTETLTLFDGMTQGKKLFVITCNEIRKLNDYLVNRPGRFHYHLRFEFPVDDEVREYMTDKLDAKYHGEIEKVVAFSHKVNLNYDCLRAIVFELSTGLPFEEAIKDLNILKVENEWTTLVVYFTNGEKSERRQLIDMWSEEKVKFEFQDKEDWDFYVEFTPGDNVYDYTRGGVIIRGEDVKLDWQNDYYDSWTDLDEEDKKDPRKVAKAQWFHDRQNQQVSHILFKRPQAKKLHYMV